MNINDTQKKVYEFILQYLDDNNYPPTVREICSKLGLKSTSTVQYHLKKLESQGLITFGGKNRAITVTERRGFHKIPVVGSVAAGVPILAVENIESYCPLPDSFGYEEDMFMLVVKGTSMINAGIYHGDRIIVKKTSACNDGDIVIAMVEDNATCKRLFHRNGKIILHPENDAMEDMIYDEVSVIGKVCGLIRKF